MSIKSHETESLSTAKWSAKRIIEPLAAYGLNLSCPSSCLVAIDEEHIIHVAGSLLILQNVDDPSKCTVLPENDRLHSILGLCYHTPLQVLAVCRVDWDGAVHLVFYYTQGLKVGEDPWVHFRKARSLVVPSSQPSDPPSHKASSQRQTPPISQQYHQRVASGGTPRLGRNAAGGAQSDADQQQQPQKSVAMDFSASGDKLILVLDGIIHLVDWERSKYNFHYVYPGSAIHTIRFDPLDSTRLCVSGQGFLKLWWLKHKSMSPIRDIQGLDPSKQTVVDHLWLGDGGGTLIAIVKEGSFYCVDVSKAKQQVIPCVLGRHELQPRALALLNTQAVAVLGDRGRIAILREIHRKKEPGASTVASNSSTSAFERFTLTRILIIAGHSNDILGVRPLSINRVVCWSHGYIGTTSIDRLLIAPRGSGSKNSTLNATMGTPGVSHEEEEEDMPTVDLHICKEFHQSPVVAMATCARKPLLATCTTSSTSGKSLEPNTAIECTIRVWHHRLHRCLIMHAVEKGRVPTCLAFHPAGNQLLISFEDRVKVYQIMDRFLRLAYEIPFKGLLRIPTTKTSYPVTKVDLTSFNHGGSLIAVVTGRVIQIFSFYSTRDGFPAKEYVLAGHTDNINSVVWSLDDLRLFSSSQDAILEWKIGQQVRVREVAMHSGKFLELGLSFDGTLVCSRFEKAEDHPSGRDTYCLYVWPGRASGGTIVPAVPTVTSPYSAVASNTSSKREGDATPEDLEQPYRMVNLPAEAGAITCLVTTTNHSTEFSASLVENAVIMGTETGAYYLLNLGALIAPSAVPSNDELLGIVPIMKSPQLPSRTLHSGKATAAALSVDGTTFFSAAEDGSIFISTLRLHRDHDRRDSRSEDMYSSETILSDGVVVLAERTFLAGIEAQIQQLQYDMMEQQSAISYQLEAASQEKERVLSSTIAMHALELKAKDKRLGELEEFKARLELDLVTQLQEREDAYAKGASELELMYQKKLATASMQFQKLKNAFNDLVVAAKDDTAEVKTEGRMKEQDLAIRFEKEKQSLIGEQEVLRGYVEYLKKQYAQLMDKEDRSHDDQVLKLKADLQVERERVQEASAKHKTQTHMLQKEIAMLHNVMTEKDDVFLDMKVRLERERQKTRQFEQRLRDQEEEINNQKRMIENSEAKTNEQAEKLEELKKIKKVLVFQLKEVRESLPKKEKNLVELQGHLQELDQEYGKGLQTQANSDKKINDQRSQIKHLQQDLLLLRRAHAKKTNILENIIQEFQALVHGDVDEEEDFEHWKEKMRQYLPCLKRDDAGNPGLPSHDKKMDVKQISNLTIQPLTPRDLVITDQAKQKDFLLKDIDRLNKKLDDNEGRQGRLVEIRTHQNKLLMQEMNKLRRQNRKLELKTREMTVKFEAEGRKSRGLSQLLERTGLPHDMITTFSSTLVDTLAYPAFPSITHRNNNHDDAAALSLILLDPMMMTKTLPDCIAISPVQDQKGGKGVNALKLPTTSSAAILKASPTPFYPAPPVITRSVREMERLKETQRANQAEAELDVALSEKYKITATISALSQFLKSIGHPVEEKMLLK